MYTCAVVESFQLQPADAAAAHNYLYPLSINLEPPLRDMPQDLPPAGGYEAVQYKRNLPTKGFRPFWYLLAVGAVMTYGWRKVFIGQREKIELGREKMWAKIHLTPLLQAEEDRDQVRRHFADRAREKELLGSESSPYNSDRFVRPTFSSSPTQTQEK